MDATDPNATINMVLPTLTQPTKSETVAFGPWMLVEKLQRRHAHVLVDDMGVWVDNDARRSRGVMEHVVVPRQQGKLNEGDKQQRAVPVRKPLTIDDFPIVSKPNPKVGSSRVASRKSNTVLLEKSRHSAVVISKNSNPNCPARVRHLCKQCKTVQLSKWFCNLQRWALVTPSFVELLSNTCEIFVHCHITDKSCGSSALATVVYGSPNTTKRKAMWFNLCNLVSSINSSWVLFGDFNATINVVDCASISSSMKPSNFFKSLFTVDVWPPNRFPVHGCFPGLSSDATSSLDSVPSDQGIYSALMEMAALK
ncbi:hypothetical protein V6N13_130243 [Hibiscus sabdariffa]